MIKIRLWGTEEEISKFADLLKEQACIRIMQRSTPYADRGESEYKRIYLEAEIKGDVK